MKKNTLKIGKILIIAICITLINSVFIFSASAATFPKLADVYMAELFLADDTQPGSITNPNKYIGVNQAPLSGNSYLDKTDKKQGESSLAEKASSGGVGLGFWMSADKFTPAQGGTPVNIESSKNPALHIWMFISNNKAIGGDRSASDDTYGTIQIDVGNDIGNGVNADASKNFWIDANSFTNGWNEIVLPLKPAFLSGKTTFVFDNRTIGTKFSTNFDYSNVNWFRVNIVTKSALLVKIDDIYYCDLGTTPSNNDNGGTTQSTSSSSVKSTTGSVSTSSQSISENNTSTSSVSSKVSDESNSTSKSSSVATNGDKKTNTGLIIGIIIAAIAVIGMGSAAYYFLIMKKKV